MSQRDSDGPDIKELIRGAANGYDLLRQYTNGQDPKTRVAADHLDKVSVSDVLDQANSLVGGRSGQQAPRPLVSTREVGNGIKITVDLTGTAIDASTVTVEVDGGNVVLGDEHSGWDATVSGVADLVGESPDAAVSRNNQHVTVTVTPSTDDSEPDVEETEMDSDESDDSADDGGLNTGMGSAGDDLEGLLDDDPVPADGDQDHGDDDRGEDGADEGAEEDVPTVEEFVSENPWVRDVVGDDEIDMALTYMADEPVSEVLGDEIGDMG